MKFTFFVSLCLLSHLAVSAQEGNYKIVYIHCIQFDTAKQLLNNDGFSATLTGNGWESNYTMNKIYYKTADTSSMTVEKALKNAGTYNLKMQGAAADSFGNQVYFNRKFDSVYLREKMPDEYIITKEKAPRFNWVITKDSMTILGYKCVMAKMDFRGRRYTAYFTTEIPIAAGPWKFNGLPGLILQIEDDRNQVKMFATKVDYPVDEPVQEFAGIGRLIDASEYVTLRDKYNEKIIRRIEQANSGQMGYDKTIISPKIKRTQGIYGIELKVD